MAKIFEGRCAIPKELHGVAQLEAELERLVFQLRLVGRLVDSAEEILAVVYTSTFTANEKGVTQIA